MDGTRDHFGGEQTVSPVCGSAATIGVDAQLHRFLRGEVAVQVHILGSLRRQVEGQRFILEPFHRIGTAATTGLATRTFTVGEGGGGGVTVRVLTDPIVGGDTVRVGGVLRVAAGTAAARPCQELGVGPVVVRHWIGCLLGGFGGIVADVQQLIGLAVVNLDIELRITKRTAARFNTMRAVHILDGEGEHHQQCAQRVLGIEPVLDLRCLVTGAVARSATDTDGRVLMAARGAAPVNGQVFFVDVTAAHLVASARVVDVLGDDRVGGRIAASLYADGGRVVVRTTVLALCIGVLCVA